MKYVRSLGGLRPNQKPSNPNAPEYLGRLLLTRQTINDIVDDMKTNPNDIIEVSLAGWKNTKKHKSGYTDKYLTIEVRSVKQKKDKWYKTSDEENPISSLDQFFQ